MDCRGWGFNSYLCSFCIVVFLTHIIAPLEARVNIIEDIRSNPSLSRYIAAPRTLIRPANSVTFRPDSGFDVISCSRYSEEKN